MKGFACGFHLSVNILFQSDMRIKRNMTAEECSRIHEPISRLFPLQVPVLSRSSYNAEVKAKGVTCTERFHVHTEEAIVLKEES